MKFCRECRNLMLPKEDKEGNVLINACRICDYWELIDEDRTKVPHQAKEMPQVLQIGVNNSTPRTRNFQGTESKQGEAVSNQSSSAAKMSPMKFCLKCGNLMLPMEDKEGKSILKCRIQNCDYQEAADDNRDKVPHHTPEMPRIPQDVVDDPTLPRARNVQCPECNNKKAVIVQASTRGEGGEKKKVTIYVCCNPDCRHQWRK